MFIEHGQCISKKQGADSGETPKVNSWSMPTRSLLGEMDIY